MKPSQARVGSAGRGVMELKEEQGTGPLWGVRERRIINELKAKHGPSVQSSAYLGHSTEKENMSC